MLLEVDGIQVDSALEYLALLRTYTPGAKVVLTLLRGVDELKSELRPGDRVAESEGVRVDTLETFILQIEATLGRLPLRLGVCHGNRGYLVEMP